MKINIKATIEARDWLFLAIFLVIASLVMHGHYDTCIVAIQKWLAAAKTK